LFPIAKFLVLLLLCADVPLGPVHTGNKVDLQQSRLCRKDVQHSGDKNHPLSTKSTELNMFNFGDNVDRDKLSSLTLSPASTARRQSQNSVTRDKYCCSTHVQRGGDSRLSTKQ